MIKDFSFKVPQTIEFGMGSLNKLPEILKLNDSENVIVISDRGLEKIGVVKKVVNIIEASGLKHTEFLDVLPNPTVEIVNKAVEVYKECGATSIIALGGGSPMDVAKAVAALVKYGGKVHDYVGMQKVPGPVVPIIAIPTTAGTGSEVTASSVITDEETHFKMSIVSHMLLPQYAILDPELIMTAPASIAAACGIDAFIHALEAYLSTFASPYTDAMAEKAMELIGAHIRRFVANRQDSEAACAMMLGSTFAGMSFAWARLGNVHAMSHPVSGFFHVAHGVANAILLPTVLEYNMLADNGRYEKIYNYISTEKSPISHFKPMMLVEEIRKLNKELGIPENLREVGVTEDKFEAMAIDAMKSGNVAANPRHTNQNDMIELYRKAF